MEKMPSLIPPERLLSDQEIDRILSEQIYPQYFDGIVPPELRQAELVYIAGQPGSGKSTREHNITNSLNSREPNTAVSINCDDMRAFHPKYADLQLEDDVSAALKINSDNEIITNSLIDKSIDTGCHVVLEGTFRSPESVAGTTVKFRKAGYEASAIVLAVHPIISRLGIIDRYLDERQEHGVGRFTYRHIHDETVAAMPKTVHRFITQRLDSEITLMTRDGNMLYNADIRNANDDAVAGVAEEAKQVLVNEHARKLTEAEFLFVERKLAHNANRALMLDAPPEVTEDLLNLHADVLTY